MLKAKTFAYDGKGNYKVSNESEIKHAVLAMGMDGKGMYAEKWVPFWMELAGMSYY